MPSSPFRSITAWWTSRLRALQFGDAYLRLYPNPGFSLWLPAGRHLHYCQACGWCLLGPGQVRRARRRSQDQPNSASSALKR